MEFGCLVFANIAGPEQAQALGQRFGVLGEFQRGKFGTGRRTIGDGLPVEGEADLVALGVFLLLVEALAGFVAQPAAVEHGLDEWRQLERFTGAGLGKIRNHVGQDVDAHHVRQAEAAGAGPAECTAGECVDLFYGETLFLHQLQGLGHDVDANPVGYEVGCVAGIDDRLAQATIGKVGDGGHGRRIGLRGGDDLEQAACSAED